MSANCFSSEHKEEVFDHASCNIVHDSQRMKQCIMLDSKGTKRIKNHTQKQERNMTAHRKAKQNISGFLQTGVSIIITCTF
jgi:hypothetical protein